MATYTDAYGLAMPEYSEPADIKVLNENFEKIDKLLHDTRAMIAKSYDSTKTYKVGDVVIYENVLYKCITEITEPESFVADKWQIVTASETGSTTDDIGKAVDFSIENGTFKVVEEA